MILKSSFFSGFCFYKEEELFNSYIENSIFNIQGFSYGAIKAFEFALNSKTRVDKLQLFSPAFFQNEDKKFRKLQLLSFRKNEENYINNFLENVKYGSNKNIENYFKKGNYSELEELLNYIWEEEKLQKLLNKGIKLEVYLGQKDRIINSIKANDFFKNFAEVYYIKDVGHIL